MSLPHWLSACDQVHYGTGTRPEQAIIGRYCRSNASNLSEQFEQEGIIKGSLEAFALEAHVSRVVFK
jgi:hypothetical protein